MLPCSCFSVRRECPCRKDPLDSEPAPPPHSQTPNLGYWDKSSLRSLSQCLQTRCRQCFFVSSFGLPGSLRQHRDKPTLRLCRSRTETGRTLCQDKARNSDCLLRESQRGRI